MVSGGQEDKAMQVACGIYKYRGLVCITCCSMDIGLSQRDDCR